MLVRLLLLLIVVPLVELALLLWLAEATHWWVTLLVVILTGFLGAVLARRQGWQTQRRIRRELAEGRLPTDALLDALLIFVAGALLLTPGMLTDLLGLFLLLPPCRRVFKARLVRWLKSRFRIQDFPASVAGQAPPHDEIIDSYVVGRSSDKPGDVPPED